MNSFHSYPFSRRAGEPLFTFLLRDSVLAYLLKEFENAMPIVLNRPAGHYVKKVTSFSVHVPRGVPKANYCRSPIPTFVSAASTSGGDRADPGAAASTRSIRSHTTIFAARKPDGTLSREVKGKKRPFVCTAWALPGRLLSPLSPLAPVPTTT